MKTAPTGLLLSLDGIDGCGKTTQCQRLTAWLRELGHRVTECADPGSTAVGAEVRRLLLDHRSHLNLTCEMFLFMASRAQLVHEIILPALERGEIVVSDRYLLANIVYQGYAGGLDPELIRRIGQTAIAGREPDLTIVLDLPVEVARARRAGASDRFENRDLAFHERVRAGFLTEAQRWPDRIRVVQAHLPPDEVQQQIRRQVGMLLECRKSGTQ